MVPAHTWEKWFAYMQGNTLYLHLNWTGHAIYQATFADGERGRSYINSAIVTSNVPGIATRGDDEFEQRELEKIIVKIFKL